MQDNPDRKAGARTTNAPHSEIKMKEEGEGGSNQIKSNDDLTLQISGEFSRSGWERTGTMKPIVLAVRP